MKKFLYLSILATVVFSGCGKAAKFAKNITGKWNFTTWDFVQKVNGVTNGQASYLASGKGSIELKKDRTGSASLPLNSGGTMMSNINITNWFCDGANVTIIFDNTVTSEKNLSYTFNATTNEKDAQVWVSDVTRKDLFSGLQLNEKLTITLAPAE